MSVFAGAMIFNGYPTNADKKRAEASSGWAGQQDSSAITPRSGGVDEGADGSFQVCIAADSAELPEFPVWTNALESLCVTGVAIGQTSVWLRVSWPSSEPPASGLIDIFLASDCDASTWTFGGSVPVPASTNAIPQPATHFVSSSYSYDVSCLAVEGRVYVRGFRDLNGNGIYDEDVDGLFSHDLTSADRGRTIQLTIGDSDSDTVVDSKEIEGGTSPVNRRSYCFNCELEICNVFSTTNYLLAEACMGANRLYGPVVQTNETLSLDLGHLVTTNAEAVTVYFWDDIDGDLERDAAEPCTSVRTSAQTHETSCRFSLPLGDFDADSDGLADWWQDYYQLQDDAFTDTDSDGLINLHEWWAGTNPLVPDGSNTVLSICCRSIDERIRGKNPGTALRKFSTYEPGNWIANTNFWARDVDTSSASFWNSFAEHGTFRKAGTLLSKRHVLFANHYPPSIGGDVLFLGTDNNIYVNTIVATSRVENTDILIGLLQNEMPDAVSPAKLLPEGYEEYICTGTRLPVCQFDYDEKGLVCELEKPLSSYATTRTPLMPDRIGFYENTVSGDSGNPVYLILDNSAILLGALHIGNIAIQPNRYEGAGAPFATYFASEIQIEMDKLMPGYNLDFFDFSQYQKTRMWKRSQE